MKKYIFGIIILFVIVFSAWWFFGPVDYYEYDVESGSECLPGELYDEEYNVCYFDFYCESEEECNEIDNRYDQVLDSLAEGYIESEHEHQAYGSEIIEKGVKEDSVTEDVLMDSGVKKESIENGTAEVVPEENVLLEVGSIEPKKVPMKELVTPKPLPKEYKTIDSIITTVLPPAHRSRIAHIVVESDGVDGVLASVEPANGMGSSWILAYDPEDAFASAGVFKNIDELLTTLIHEYAHIVTLHNSQVEHVSDDAEYIECAVGQIIVDEGCALSGSYITTFVNTFWSENDRDAAFKAMENGEDEDFAVELHDARQQDFVTEYAATNEIEDMAESFALFVMKSKPTDMTVASQKIQFFYRYPELVTLRQYMRGGVGKIVETIK